MTLDKNKEILGQIDGICDLVVEQFGHMFNPEIVEAFLELKDREYFWWDLTSDNMTYILNNAADGGMLELGIDELIELSKLFARLIDFRSPFI